MFRRLARITSLVCSWLVVSVMLVGCSSSKMDESLIQSSEVNLQEAIKLVEGGQSAQALPMLDKCINEGGLNADLLSTALIQRARCQLEAGNTDAAGQDLERAEQGSAPLDQLYLVKGLLMKKLGKAQEASAEFAKAKKISPKIKIPQ